MDYIEPEGLYPTYRLPTTQKIAALVQTGESFKIVAKSGTGKSKYLRYISSSKTIKSNHFKNTLLYYIDLNRAYQNTTDQLIKIIADALNEKGTTGEAIESKIEQLLTKNSKIYFILDQAENLNGFEETTVRFLRSLRDNQKGKVGFILSFEKEVGINERVNKYLLEISSIEIKFNPLSNDEAKEVTLNLAKNLNVQLNNEDLSLIVTTSKGSPKVIRQLVTQVLAGNTVKESVQNLEQIYEPETTEQYVKLTSENKATEDVINTVEKNLTKNEQLFFKEMYKNFNGVVKRDEFAVLLSPDSQGSGVSDEAIDQVISRTRKAIKKLKLPYSISTARGVGYFLE